MLNLLGSIPQISTEVCLPGDSKSIQGDSEDELLFHLLPTWFVFNKTME